MNDVDFRNLTGEIQELKMLVKQQIQATDQQTEVLKKIAMLLQTKTE